MEEGVCFMFWLSERWNQLNFIRFKIWIIPIEIWFRSEEHQMDKYKVISVQTDDLYGLIIYYKVKGCKKKVNHGR